MKEANIMTGDDFQKQSEEEFLAYLDNKIDDETLRLMEQRYENENKLLAAVMAGDTQTALAIEFENYAGVPSRYHISVSARKSALYTFNTLCRKIVQYAEVHPAHIDHVSAYYASLIEREKDASKLNDIYRDMVRRYCLLVQNYSLKGFSVNVQNALNFVDFHLTDPLTLAYVAEKISVNKKYLSAQFKKEYGCNLTDYINEKRIRESLRYLALTGLSVQDVAERVGILDINYYSRVFKRVMNMTPTGYRKMLQGEQE